MDVLGNHNGEKMRGREGARMRKLEGARPVYSNAFLALVMTALTAAEIFRI